MVFNYACDSGLTETPIRFGKALKTPHARIFRRLANERGERMFTREEVLALVQGAGLQLKAMIYLGTAIQPCGYGGAAFGATLAGRLAANSSSASAETRYRTRLPLPTLTAPKSPDAIQPRTVSGETPYRRATWGGVSISASGSASGVLCSCRAKALVLMAVILLLLRRAW
jgi:hypothetical protein